MGLFNTYGNVQLKVRDLMCNHYELGDKVPIRDGVYVGNNGVVTVKKGKLVEALDYIAYDVLLCLEPFNKIYDKFGDKISRAELTNRNENR